MDFRWVRNVQEDEPGTQFFSGGKPPFVRERTGNILNARFASNPKS